MSRTPEEPLGDRGRDGLVHARFTRVRLREGYARPQVDAFISHAVEDLTSPAPTLRADDVRSVRFTPVRLREGYDMAEVDSYLDELEQRAAARSPQDGEAPQGRASTSRTGAPPAWLGWLKWALLVAAVVLWLYASVFPSR